MNKCLSFTIDHADPETVVLSCRESLTIDDDAQLLAINYPFCEYWSEQKLNYRLTGIYLIESVKDEINFAVFKGEIPSLEDLSKNDRDTTENFSSLCAELGIEIFSSKGILPLQPVVIPKPWGQEVWFTGIEERGVACVGAAGSDLSLPCLLSALPVTLSNGLQQQLILLKTLDPLPDEVFGDLYFELHQQKREVYVVTAVDEKAWPDGEGAIRFGFNQDKRVASGSDEAFLDAFLASVADYQAVRSDIDERLDDFKRECGIAASEPAETTQMKTWLASLPAALQDKELQLRNAMNDYTALQPLQVGDVVKVPCLTPHSLQHGVRTIEFQTPVYERLIVSFAQKVLTQRGWDTEQAAGLMVLEPPEQESFEILIDADGVKQEKIVNFEDFEVYRCQLESGRHLQLPASNHYTLLVSISGSLDVLGSVLSEEQAAFIPQQCEMKIAAVNSNQSVTFLLARPKLAGLS